MKSPGWIRGLLGACLVSAVALAPSLAVAQVDPTRVFYAIAFTHGSPHNGVITAQSLTAPYGVVASAARGTANGAITFDPGRSILYAGACCTANSPLQAYDPATLTRVAARDINFTSTSSIAPEVDGPRRVIFVYDTVDRSLRAISLAEGTRYGTVVATTTLSDLPAEPTPTSVGDQLAVDTRGQRVFVTGGDGGPVVSVDVSRITAEGGTFGAVVNTGHRNRSTGNSAGAVAVDEAGRRVFFVPTTGVVRMVNADAPFAMIGDITVPSMATNDCGLYFDARTGNLYVGRGASAPPAVVSFPSLTVTPFATGPGDVPALSFAGAGVGCVDRDEDGFFPAACAMAGARVDCDDTRREVNPGATETCNGTDDDCDALTDEGFCRIDGTCHADGTVNPMNACQSCVAPATASGTTAWGNRPPGTVCRASGGVCDVAESCDGTGAQCPADAFHPATMMCRESAGACDVAERCDGMSAACPADGFVAADTVCRPTSSIAACDPQETCSGTSATCPDDRVTRAPTTEMCNGEDDDCDGMIDEPPCMPIVDAGPEDVGVIDSGPDDSGADDSGTTDVTSADAANESDVGAVDVSLTDATADASVKDVATSDVTAQDASIVTDAPAAVDALVVADASKTTDVTSSDAGGGADAGQSGKSDGGCGCATPGQGTSDARWGLALWVALVVAVRRRRR
jgi:MYXO-CTERM domain-containing protein